MTFYFNWKPQLIISLLFFLGLMQSEAHSEEWTTSQLVRFGEFRHPTSFKRLKAVWEDPDFQGSQAALNEATISDGKMSLEFNIIYVTLNEMWIEDLQKHNSAISYKVKKNDWYVVSGVNGDDMVFYKKAWFIEGMCVSINFLYPWQNSSKYDRILEQMLKGYKPKLELSAF